MVVVGFPVAFAKAQLLARLFGLVRFVVLSWYAWKTQSLSHLNKPSQLSRTEYTLSQTEKATYPHIASQPVTSLKTSGATGKNVNECVRVSVLTVIFILFCIEYVLHSLSSLFCLHTVMFSQFCVVFAIYSGRM